MIKIGSAISTNDNPVDAANEVFDRAIASLEGNSPDLAFVFVSSAHGAGRRRDRLHPGSPHGRRHPARLHYAGHHRRGA